MVKSPSKGDRAAAARVKVQTVWKNMTTGGGWVRLQPGLQGQSQEMRLEI